MLSALSIALQTKRFIEFYRILALYGLLQGPKKNPKHFSAFGIITTNVPFPVERTGVEPVIPP